MANDAVAAGSRWRSATTGLLALTGLLFLYIEVRVLQDGEKLIVPVAIILVLDLVIAALLAITRRIWLIWPAMVILLVGAIGDLPHQVDQLAHSPSPEHLVVSVLVSVVQIAGIVAAAGCGLAARRGFQPRTLAPLDPRERVDADVASHHHPFVVLLGKPRVSCPSPAYGTREGRRRTQR